jgi:hypothetical protein
MPRLILAFVALLGLVPAASASLAPRKVPTRLDNYVPPVKAPGVSPAKTSPLPVEPQTQVTTEAPSSDFVVTEQTEIILNGKPCKYKDVPGHATILRMELRADKRTVLRIHFRTRK